MRQKEQVLGSRCQVSGENPKPRTQNLAPNTSSDSRHAPIRAEIRRLYMAATNPPLPPPWTGHHGRALDRLLKANPKWPVDVWIRCVRNRFASEDINLGEDPIRWIPRLPDYVRGRLNKFGKPKPLTADEHYHMTHATGDWLSTVYYPQIAPIPPIESAESVKSADKKF